MGAKVPEKESSMVPGSEISMERTGQGTNSPGSKRAREQKFQEMNWPGS